MTVQAVPQTITAVLRPPRLNFAQVCIWCETRWCESAECIAAYERSVWRVCSRCDGFTWLSRTQKCPCLNGLEEAMSEPVAERRYPMRPSWHDDDDEFIVTPPAREKTVLVRTPGSPGYMPW